MKLHNRLRNILVKISHSTQTHTRIHAHTHTHTHTHTRITHNINDWVITHKPSTSKMPVDCSPIDTAQHIIYNINDWVITHKPSTSKNASGLFPSQHSILLQHAYTYKYIHIHTHTHAHTHTHTCTIYSVHTMLKFLIYR